jgi:hypothetical protein
MTQKQTQEILPRHSETLGYERANAELEAFVYNPALESVLAAGGFDVSQEQTTDRATYIQNMKDFAEDAWNFRKHKERIDMSWQDTPVEDSELYDAFVALGMVESSRLTQGNYDFMLIPGGANRSPLQRLQFGLEQGVDCKYIVLLGAGRKVEGEEVAVTSDYAPGAKTEYDLMDGAARTLLGEDLVSDEPLLLQNYPVASALPGHWKINYIEGANDTHIFSLHSDYEVQNRRSGQDRANTGDTYKFLRSISGDALGEDSSIALVTQALNSNAQHLDAVRELTLATGAQVETVGSSAEYSGAKRTEKQVLQEIYSAIKAAARLEAALAASENH